MVKQFRHDFVAEKVVLFLTDGRPNDARDSILQTLREENKKLNNQVIIFTFALGTSMYC